MKELKQIIALIWLGGFISVNGFAATWVYDPTQPGGSPRDIHCSPAVGDIDCNEPGSETVFGCLTHVPGTYYSKVYCLKSTGGLNWSYNIPDFWELPYHPVIANISDAPNCEGPEVLFHTFPCQRTATGKIYCLNCKGDLQWSFATHNKSARAGLTIADIDGDGNPEILAGGKNSAENIGLLYCLNSGGSNKTNFPYSTTIDVIVTSPAVANIDESGMPEIIFGAGDKVYCLNSNGTPKWVYTVPGGGPNITIHIDAVSIADVNRDGFAEILATGRIDDPAAGIAGITYNMLYCIDHDGGVLMWSEVVYSGNLADGKRAKGISMAAIGDVVADADDKPEIVVQSNTSIDTEDKIVVYRDAGTSATEVWRVDAEDDVDGSGAAPILYDMDADGFKDIIWIGSDYLRIYYVPTMSWYQNTDFKSATAFEHPAIADIDEDGVAEIIGMYEFNKVGAVSLIGWPPARDQFSSYSYHITNINDDLSVPEIEPPHWETHNSWLAQGFVFDTILVEGWFDQFTTPDPPNIVRDINGTWAVGDNGLIARRNSNSNWGPVPIAGFTPTDWDFQGVCEVNPNLVFIVGVHNDVSTNPAYGKTVATEPRGVILKNDAGNWTAIYSTDPQVSATGYNLAFYCIDFYNDQIGYIGASGGYVLKTTDGGSNWEETWKKPFPLSAVKEHFSDCVKSIWVDKTWSIPPGGHIWATMDNSGWVARTRDGGTTWDIKEHPPVFDNVESISNPYGWGQNNWDEAPTNWRDVRHANFGITGFSGDAVMGISTGGNGLYVEPWWDLVEIDKNTPNSLNNPNRIMYPTWFMDNWFGDVGGGKQGLFFAATSDAIYNSSPSMHREHFLKNDDLYTVYSDGDIGWMAWAGGRHPTTTETGTIIGKYYEHFQVSTMVRGCEGGVKIKFIIADGTKISDCVVYRSVCEEGPFDDVIPLSLTWTGVWEDMNLSCYTGYDNTVQFNMPYWYKIKIILNDPPSFRVSQFIGPFKAEPWGLAAPGPISLLSSVSLTGIGVGSHGEVSEYGLEWSPETAAGGGSFFVYRSEVSDVGPYEYIATVPSSPYWDTTGEVGREYFYTVRIVDSRGVPSSCSFNESPPLSMWKMTGAADEIPPPKVTLPAVAGSWDASKKIVRLAWDPVPFDGSFSHEPNLGGYWVSQGTKDWPGLIPSGLTTLAPIQRTWYEYQGSIHPSGGAGPGAVFRVCAMDRSGNIGPWSDPIAVCVIKGCKWVACLNGSDSNPGTEELPWATIQHAANNLQPGWAVAVREGVYHETVIPYNSGNPDSGAIYYFALPGETVIITGDNTRDYGFKVSDKSRIAIEGFEIRDCKECGILYENAPYGEIWDTRISNNKIGIKVVNSSLMGRENAIVYNDSIGILTTSAEGVNFGNATYPEAEYNPGDNYIYGNGVWNFVNEAVDGVLAQSNYWGTTDSISMASTILGPIIFTPFDTIPPAPILIAPSAGDTIYGLTVFLDWTYMLEEGIVYTLWWDTDSTFTNYTEVNSLVESKYVLDSDTLPEATTIYWKVKATDAEDNFCWSEASNFYWDLPTTYWVATDGDDANPGTRDAPWRTIQKAANTLQPWERVFVREGTYNQQQVIEPQNSGKSDSGIVYQAYPGESVVLNGKGFKLNSKSYITLAGFTIQNFSFTAVELNSAEGVGSSYNIIRRCTITAPNVVDGIKVSGSENALCRNNLIELTSIDLGNTSHRGIRLDFAPATQVSEVTIQGGPIYGIQIDNQSDSSSVENCVIRDNLNYGIYVSSDPIKIGNNILRKAGKDCIYLENAPEALIWNNNIDSTGMNGSGICLNTGCNKTQIWDNKISGNTVFGVKLESDNDSVDIYRNTISSNTSIYLGELNDRVKIYENVIDSASDYGIRIDCAGNANSDIEIYRNNICCPTGKGICIEKNDQPHIRIYNNLISAKWGIYNRGAVNSGFYFNSMRCSNACYYQDGHTGTVDFDTLENNIFYTEDGYCIYAKHFSPPTGFLADYNDLFVAGDGKVGYWGFADKPTLANWQMTGQDANSISTDPLFVSLADLHILENSPCIDAGTPISWITIDFDGQERDTLPDIGGDEWYYGGGGTQCGGGKQGRPMVFRFSQNYPNPFVKFTTIKYQIPAKSKVSLKVYDVAGRCVKTLIDGEKSIGYYKVKWDGEGLSTGIYFAKFKAGDYKSTKKLILMR